MDRLRFCDSCKEKHIASGIGFKTPDNMYFHDIDGRPLDDSFVQCLLSAHVRIPKRLTGYFVNPHCIDRNGTRTITGKTPYPMQSNAVKEISISPLWIICNSSGLIITDKRMSLCHFWRNTAGNIYNKILSGITVDMLSTNTYSRTAAITFMTTT